jgi:hypothetical protein
VAAHLHLAVIEICRAIDVLLEEGYADEQPGPRNARLIASLKPYREADDTTAPDRASTAPDRASGPDDDDCASAPPRLSVGGADGGPVGGPVNSVIAPTDEDIPF